MKKIVLAEDDRQVRKVMTKMVEAMGYVCLQSSSGMRALHLLEDNPGVSLLITDMVMPELNGEELIKIVRGREETRNLPIVIISGLTGYDEIAHLLDLGASRFLSKPIDRTMLEDCLKDFLRVDEAELSAGEWR